MRILIRRVFGVCALLATALNAGCATQALSKYELVLGTGLHYDAPRWSPDGAMVAYWVDLLPHGEVWIATTDGLPPRRVTAYDGFAHHPDWSPDGRQIVYMGRNDASEVWQLFTVNSDGSEAKQITRFPSAPNLPKWSPDGTRIAFSMRGGDPLVSSQLYVMSVDGKNVVQLTHPPLGQVDNLEWSPDGMRIAFTIWAGTGKIQASEKWDLTTQTKETIVAEERTPYLYAINADGTGLTRVVDWPGMLYLTWSPDGKHILVDSTGGYHKEFPFGYYLVNTDGSGMRRIQLDRSCKQPNWGKANNKLVFVCGDYWGARWQILSANMQDLLK